MEGSWLSLVWFAIIAFAIFMYVLLDGFTVAPIWDGNETWLVLGAGGLFAVFPLAYSIVLPALYLPFVFMLLGLIFRGIAFEFRFKAERGRALWSRAFHVGSLIATFAQGIVLGAFVQGFELEGNHYAGGAFDWLTPFGILTGVALLLGYALLGSTWLIIKAPGTLESWARGVSKRLLLAVLVAIALISVWVPFLDTGIAERWFSLPNFYYLSQVPLLTAIVASLHWQATVHGKRIAPFALTMALFALGYAGLAISLWPDIVPHQIPYWTAAAAPSSQRFLLVGALIAMPAVLGYTAYSYYVFRGKASCELEY